MQTYYYEILVNGTHRKILKLGETVRFTAGDFAKLPGGVNWNVGLTGNYVSALFDNELTFHRIPSPSILNSTEQVLFVNNLHDSHKMADGVEITIPISGSYFYRQNNKSRLEFFDAGDALELPIDFLVMKS